MNKNLFLLFPLLFFLLSPVDMVFCEDYSEYIKQLGEPDLKVESVAYRPAQWEVDKVTEPVNERPNQGGLVFVYLKNVSDNAVSLRHWYLNGEDYSYHRQAGNVAWDRIYDRHLQPGEMTVLELNGVTEMFAPGQPFVYAHMNRSWKPCGWIQTTLKEDPLQISYIRIAPGMKEIEIFIRNRDKKAWDIKNITFPGSTTLKTQIRGKSVQPNSFSILRSPLEKPLTSSRLLIAKILLQSKEETKTIFAHRRAFADYFPIGTWSNNDDTLPLLYRHHIDTVVRGGRKNDAFFKTLAAQYGMKSMVPIETIPYIERVQELTGHPAVACWMLGDEPDWGHLPVEVKLADTLARRHDSATPTFTTLCRNVRFFEFAHIVDIPCMDHYAVTAPSSSKWPHRWGTRLEETAYYTRDLKRAAEPKPIWIWSQALAGWDERPKQPVPTPKELAAQLLFNLGRGAKGILWFNFDIGVGKKYPATQKAVREWSRVLQVMRDDLLASEPLPDAGVSNSIESLFDLAILASWDKLILIATNCDYTLRDDGYVWEPRDLTAVFPLPEWIQPTVGWQIGPRGVNEIPFKKIETSNGAMLEVQIKDLNPGAIHVFANDAAALKQYKGNYQEAWQREQ